MANFDTLKALIAAKIHDNTEQEITAEDVRDSFNAAIDAINAAKEDEGAIAPAAWGGITGTLSAQTDLQTALDGKQAVIADLADIRSGAAAGATAYQKPSAGIPGTDLTAGVRSDLNKARSAVQPGDLALVASTGDYDDLLDKPTIPDAQVQSDWNEADSSLPSYIRNKPNIPSGVVVDQTYDPTSANAQSGVAVAGALAPVEEVIPSAATSSNQLADKAFVNSSVATNTANYISDNGEPFTSLAALEAYSGTLTNNDYAFVVGTDAAGNTTYTRYKYNASTDTWAEEYVLNNSSFTSTQWAAINSGITSGDVALIATAVQPGDLATVATSGSYADLLNKPTIPAAPGTLNTNNTGAQSVSSSEALSGTIKLHKVSKTGSYADLNNKPTIPAAQVNSDWNAASGVAQILNKPSLAAVATSGAYSDLTGTPTIPSAPGTLQTNLTTAQSTSASEALSGAIKLHQVSKTGSYNDLLNKPTIDATPTSASTNAVQSGGVYSELADRYTKTELAAMAETWTFTLADNSTVTKKIIVLPNS